MRVWYFSEMAYHPAWEEGLKRGSLRVVLPNSTYDPKVGHQLLNRYLHEFALCDEVGLDIMVNEHHSTATCLTISVPMALAIIARETKRSRLPGPCSLATKVVTSSAGHSTLSSAASNSTAEAAGNTSQYPSRAPATIAGWCEHRRNWRT
jgi:hypothetical protein